MDNLRISILTAMTVGICLLSPTVFSADKEPNPLDTEILFWEGRLGRDAADFLPPLKLGSAYLQKSRENGDLALLSKAVKSLETALTLSPKNVEAMNRLALAFVQQHRFKEALELAEKAAKAQPKDAFAYGIMGDAWIEFNDLEKADLNYVRAMELAPEVSSLARWANLQYLRGDIPACLKFYKEALKDAESHARAPFNAAWCRVQLGHAYFRIGKFDEADALYQEALKALPDNYLPLDYLAELRGAQDRFDESIALYQKALKLAPRPEIYQALGDVLFLAQKNDESAAMHAKASELYIESINQGNTHYFHHLAGFFSDSKKSPAEAVRWARRDFELRKSVYAHDCLAWALYQTGEFTEAAAVMKKALAGGILDAHLYYHASSIYFRAGNVPASRDAIKRAAEINPLHNKFHAHRN